MTDSGWFPNGQFLVKDMRTGADRRKMVSVSVALRGTLCVKERPGPRIVTVLTPHYHDQNT